MKLRPMTIKDAKDYLECHSDKEAKKNFSSFPTTVAEAKKELKDSKKKKQWAIMVDGEFAGFVKIRLNDNPKYKHHGIIGYGIKKDFRGRGIATKAVKEVTKIGFNRLKLKRISGMCRAHNKASHRVLEKAGYKKEGILRKNKFLNGKYVDDVLYAKVK